MQPDDELCLCFHITKRKVMNFIRIEKPARVSQLSDCGGAGTGCGWCRKSLEQLFAAVQKSHDLNSVTLPTPEEYARSRKSYIDAGHGTPPAD